MKNRIMLFSKLFNIETDHIVSNLVFVLETGKLTLEKREIVLEDRAFLINNKKIINYVSRSIKNKMLMYKQCFLKMLNKNMDSFFSEKIYLFFQILNINKKNENNFIFKITNVDSIFVFETLSIYKLIKNKTIPFQIFNKNYFILALDENYKIHYVVL